MKTALIISTYNWPEALEKVLQSVQIQTTLPDEIIIADDGSGETTKLVIEKWKKISKVPVKHFWQEDKGFRKTIIMNYAIANTEAEYIIQIDGDVILEKNFIADHLSDRKQGYFLNGSRALINEDSTRKFLSGAININQVKIKNKINGTRNPFLARYFRKDGPKSNNVKGCNFSFWKKDFIKVNGYNNDINGWGHEDIELAARLVNIGLKQRRLKMKAVVFHLHHNYFDRKNEQENYSYYLNVVKDKIAHCKNGYEQSQ